MGWIEAVVLGLVQGLTEFLPISSSAHLRVVGAAFGWEDPGAAFTAITQIGTEVAVLIYFRHDIWNIIRTWVLSLRDKSLRSEPDARMGWLIIIGSIPIVVLGLLLQDKIETTFRDLRIIAIALVVFSLVLFFADRIGSKQRQLSDLTVGHGVLYGLAQAAALQPEVALVDIGLPDGDGFALTRQLRTRQPGLRVVLFSSDADRTYAAAAERVGAVGFLPKEELSGPALEQLIGDEADG